MGELFINRKAELAELRQWVTEGGDASKMLLIRSPTGIGKTDLVKRAVQYAAEPVVNVRVVDHPDYIADDGDYLLRIFRSLAQQSEIDERILSFPTFLALRNGSNLLLKAGEVGAKQLAVHFGRKYIGDEGVEALKAILNTDVKSFRQLSDGKPECIKDEVVSYAAAVLSSVRCTIRIENIQKIDRHSLEYLKSAFAQYNGLKGIFEYTVGSGENLSCEAIQAILSSEEVDCKIYDLQPIPVEELIDGLKDRPEVFRSALTRHYQDQGFNLRVIVDVSVLATRAAAFSNASATETEGSTTEQAIRSLPNSQRLLLALLATHGAEADTEVIGAALAAQPGQGAAIASALNYRRDIDELHSARYVSVDGLRVRIAHDSVTGHFLNDPANKKFALIASDIWQKFYQDVIERDDPFLKSDALHWLPVLYLGSGKMEQVVAMLEQHGRSALRSFAPRRLVSIFHHIRNLSLRVPTALQAGRLDALIERQGSVLFDSCLLDEACECFELAGEQTLSARLTYADACVATDRFETGISILENIEREYLSEDPLCRAVRMRTGLVRVHALRTDGQLEEAEALYRELLSWEDFRDQPIYASLLRCADIGLYKDDDVLECIDLLEQAVELCQKHGMLADEAAAHVALCQHFGYRGELVRARVELTAAEDISEQVWIERYSIINNGAVLDILSDCGKGAAAAFQKALLLATESGDRLLLLCNYLAVGTQSVAEELERLLGEISELSEELAKIAHYNLSIFYDEQGDSIQAHYHRAAAAAMADIMDREFWGCALRGQTPTLSAVEHRLRARYYLVFIVHWRLTSVTFQGVSD